LRGATRSAPAEGRGAQEGRREGHRGGAARTGRTSPGWFAAAEIAACRTGGGHQCRSAPITGRANCSRAPGSVIDRGPVRTESNNVRCGITFATCQPSSLCRRRDDRNVKASHSASRRRLRDARLAAAGNGACGSRLLSQAVGVVSTGCRVGARVESGRQGVAHHAERAGPAGPPSSPSACAP